MSEQHWLDFTKEFVWFEVKLVGEGEALAAFDTRKEAHEFISDDYAGLDPWGKPRYRRNYQDLSRSDYIVEEVRF